MSTTALVNKKDAPIKYWTLTKLQGKKSIHTIELNTCDPEGLTSPLDSWTIDEDVTNDHESITELSNEIMENAENHASVMGGQQLFQLRALGEHGYIANTYVEVKANNGKNYAGSNPANEKGFVAQMMRHYERMQVINNKSMAGMMRFTGQTIERQSERINHLEDERVDNIKMLEELYLQRHKQEIELKELEYDHDFKSGIFEQAAPLIPLILGKLTGMKIPAGDPLAMQLKSLIESFTEEQMESIQSTLGPEQLMVLMSIYQASEEKSKKKEVEKEKKEDDN